MRYRIRDKSEVHINGRPATTFDLFEPAGDGYAHTWSGWAPGHGLSDAECYAAAVAERDALDTSLSESERD